MNSAAGFIDVINIIIRRSDKKFVISRGNILNFRIWKTAFDIHPSLLRITGAKSNRRK